MTNKKHRRAGPALASCTRPHGPACLSARRNPALCRDCRQLDKIHRHPAGPGPCAPVRRDTQRRLPHRRDDLVATRNRAAFMVALAQYKKELAAPAAPAATKPAPRCSLYPIENPGATSRIEEDNGNLYLGITNGTLRLDVKVIASSPLAQAKEKKIFPQIAGALDHKTAAELYKNLCAYTAFLSGAELKRMAHNFDTLADLLAQAPVLRASPPNTKTAAAKAPRITSSKAAA